MVEQAFLNYLDTLREQFNRYFIEQLAAFDYPCAKLKEAVLYSCSNGGKRFRPLLVLLTGQELKLDEEILMPIAAAIEMIHCYSLIHDDLPAMDDDLLRRGKPTCHIAFDEATAILAGDILQSFALQTLLSLQTKLPASRVLLITLGLTKAMADMVSGQSLDIHGLASDDLTLEKLATTHQLKTGAMIAACVDLVLLASGDEKQFQSLKEFGRLVGLVFQIQDDYLDLYGDSERLGKPQGSDKDNQKRTYCDFYNKESLEDLLEKHYQALNASVSIFGEDNELLQFTKFLAKRDH